jgi:hypothetical protein
MGAVTGLGLPLEGSRFGLFHAASQNPSQRMCRHKNVKTSGSRERFNGLQVYKRGPN